MVGAALESRTQCPVCGSDGFRTLYQCGYDEAPLNRYLEDYYPKPDSSEFVCLGGSQYVLCECERCQLIFQRDVPNDQLSETLYEHWIDRESSLERVRGNRLPHYSRLAQEVMQTISYLGGASGSLAVLDFGMGWGDWARMARAFGCDSYGAELSEERVEYARQSGVKIVSWDEIPQRRFDFINTEQVFEHLTRPSETLRHLAQSLKDGGIIRISVPSAGGVERRLKRMDWSAECDSRDSLAPVTPLEHINCFRPSSFAELAASAGMEVVAMPTSVELWHRTDWTGPAGLAKNIVRPIYRRLVRRDDCVFLRRIQGSTASA